MIYIVRILIAVCLSCSSYAYAQPFSWLEGPKGPFKPEGPFRFIPNVDGKNINLFANVAYEYRDFGYYSYTIDGATGELKVHIWRTNDRGGMLSANKNGCGELVFFDEKNQPRVTISHSFPNGRRFDKSNTLILPTEIIRTLKNAHLRWGFCNAPTPNGDIVIQIHPT
jgi:hypothetical protein